MRDRRPAAGASGRGTAFARAALLGNPSDAFGGKTLGLALAELRAEVALGAAPETDPDASRLTAAALDRLRRTTGIEVGGGVAVSTRIPREVGLGGSSAIVIATLRAACSAAGATIEPGELAALALAVERDDLGIAAGPQDRLIQAHGGLLFMDFSESPDGRCESLDPAVLPPLFIGWRRDAAEHSGAVHADLRERHRQGDRETLAALAEAAELAAEGRRALLAGRGSELAGLMSANVAVRAQLVELDPRHLRLIELAAELGAGANYAGSGGAIVGVVPVAETIDGMRSAFAAEGCELRSATAL